MKKNKFESAVMQHRRVTGKYDFKKLEKCLGSSSADDLMVSAMLKLNLSGPTAFFLFTLVLLNTIGPANSAQVPRSLSTEELMPHEDGQLPLMRSRAEATKTQLEKALIVSSSISLAERQACFKLIDFFATNIDQLNGTQKIVDVALQSGVKLQCLPKNKFALSRTAAPVAVFKPLERRIDLSLFSDFTSEYERQQSNSILRHEFIHAAYETKKYLSGCLYKSSIFPICPTEPTLVDEYAQSLTVGDKRLQALIRQYEGMQSKIEKGKSFSIKEREITQLMQEVLADCDFVYFVTKVPADAGLARRKTFTNSAFPGVNFLIESTRQEGRETYLQLKTASKLDALKALPYYKNLMAKAYALDQEALKRRMIQTTEAEAYIRQVLGDTAFSKIYTEAWNMLGKDQAAWPIASPKPISKQ
jgi:hypothetical protein